MTQFDCVVQKAFEMHAGASVVVQESPQTYLRASHLQHLADTVASCLGRQTGFCFSVVLMSSP